MSFKILLRDTINHLVPKIIVCSVREDGFVTSKELSFQKYVRRVPIVLLEQVVNSQSFHAHQAHILIKRVSGRRVNAVHVLLENIVVMLQVQIIPKSVEQVITVRTTQPMINSMMNSATVPVHLDFIVNQEQLIRNPVHLERTVLKLDSEVNGDVQIVRKGSFFPSGGWDHRYK